MKSKFFNRIRLIFSQGWRHLPIVHQSVNAECGLACAAMLAGFWGAKIDIHEVRRRSDSATVGLTLKQLRNVLHDLQFSTRIVRVEPSLLPRVKTPAILHWGLAHYVVLKRATESFIEIHDPESGYLRVSMKEANWKLSGWAIEASPNECFQRGESKNKIDWLNWLGFRKNWIIGLLGVLILTLTSQLIVLSLPYYLQLLVDRVIPSVEVDLLPRLALMFGLLVLLDWFIKSTQMQIANLLGFMMNSAFGQRLFTHLLNSSLTYFSGRSMSDIASRFDSLDEVRRSILEDAPTIIVSVLQFVLSGVVILSFSPSLLLCVVIFLGTYILIRLFFSRRQKQLVDNSFYLRTKERSALYETLQNILTIKALSAENQRTKLWSKLLTRANYALLQLNLTRARLDHTKEAFVALELIVSLYIAAYLVLAGEMTLGMLFAFISYKRLLISSILSLVEFYIRSKAVGVHLSRLTDVVFATKEVDTSNGIKISNFDRIDLINLSHQYPSANQLTFIPINATIYKGDRWALVGHSGSGKSTLVKLILGIIDTQIGLIQINGLPIAGINRATWLERIGVVFQGDRLLAGSILENIAFFEEKLNRDRAIEVAKLACIWEKIESLPMGIDTPIQDDFTILSAGQKQRIFIARALYRNPTIIIMDEGTANLDEKLEANILKNIQSLGLTVIHATHRPQVIADATKILKLCNE